MAMAEQWQWEKAGGAKKELTTSSKWPGLWAQMDPSKRGSRLLSAEQGDPYFRMMQFAFLLYWKKQLLFLPPPDILPVDLCQRLRPRTPECYQVSTAGL